MMYFWIKGSDGKTGQPISVVKDFEDASAASDWAYSYCNKGHCSLVHLKDDRALWSALYQCTEDLRSYSIASRQEANQAPQYALDLQTQHQWYIKISPEGRVEFNPDMTLDEVAERFLATVNTRHSKLVESERALQQLADAIRNVNMRSQAYLDRVEQVRRDGDLGLRGSLSVYAPESLELDEAQKKLNDAMKKVQELCP